MKNFTSKNQKIGELGEDVACKYLEKHGFLVKERNYTKKWGEIDIIATKEGKLYFVEVKSVSRDLDNMNELTESVTSATELAGRHATFRPEENMHPWKMRRLSRTVGTYLIHNRIGNTPWQFDLLIIYLDMNKRLARVKVVENVILN
ncbi:YraN family protein [Candidatus Nomurabacteria bacterium]|nr:YraN family protein [Candidatus Nomurabacteria bacterium]